MKTSLSSLGLLARESLAGVIRVIVSAVATLASTSILLRTLSTSNYSAWILALSVGGYVGIANAGIATAIVRFGSGDDERTSEVLSGALIVVSILGAIPVVIIFLLTFLSDVFVKNVPAGLVASLRLTMVLCCVASFLALWVSALQGAFLARQRSFVSASAGSLLQVITAAALSAAAVRSHSIQVLGWITVLSAFANVAVLGALFRRSGSVQHSRASNSTFAFVGQIFRHCSATGWWALAMLVISGVDLLVVSRLDFDSVAPYGVAAQVCLAVASVVGASQMPVMRVAARAHSEGDVGKLTKTLLVGSKHANSAYALIAGLLFFSAEPIIRSFAGERYGGTATTLLRILLVANMLRHTGGVLALVMVATGEHRKALLPPLAEAIVNFVSSVALGLRFGAIGVAYGTLFGACISVGLYAFRVIPKFTAFTPKRLEYLIAANVRPLAVFVPFAIAAAIMRTTNAVLTPLAYVGWSAVVTSVALSGYLLVCVDRLERRLFVEAVRARGNCLRPDKSPR